VGLRAANTRAGHGIGLSNTQERLARMYGESHRFDLRERDEGGTIVSIEIPWRQDRQDGGAR
jgi:two-component system, LytTR family, sensor kinase